MLRMTALDLAVISYLAGAHGGEMDSQMLRRRLNVGGDNQALSGPTFHAHMKRLEQDGLIVGTPPIGHRKGGNTVWRLRKEGFKSVSALLEMINALPDDDQEVATHAVRS